MTARARLLSYGGAGVLIVLGLTAEAVFGGTTGEAVLIALVSLGAIAIVSLIFLEVGLSEDRERARERAGEGAGRAASRPPPRRRRRPD